MDYNAVCTKKHCTTVDGNIDPSEVFCFVHVHKIVHVFSDAKMGQKS
jgi:hypothetical protein